MERSDGFGKFPFFMHFPALGGGALAPACYIWTMSSDPFDLSQYDAPPFDAPPPQRPGPAPYLRGLNPPQLEAVEATEGPVLVLAGAGTGKTRVLTSRIAHLIASGKASPFAILSVTFTNKAAREMQNRVGDILGRPVEGMAIGTFHSISARMLRKHAELAGLKSNFTILDTDDQIRLLKQLIAAENIDEKRWPARMMAGLIDRWKNKAQLPDQIPEGDSFAFADGKGAKIYAEYQARLKVLNACDFGDLLMHVIHILKDHADILAGYHRRFRYLLVDEYQDTNFAQYLWLRLLAQGHKNICCVGDDDQSIYSWRGAEIGNILKFESDFPGAKIVRLEQNYRSTTHILGTAAGLIESNAGRLGKTLWTEVEGGEPVTIRGVWDGPEEARIVGDEIEDMQRKDHSLAEMAVLVRASYQTREFEDRFITLGLPYRVVGGAKFYERQEIRDALAYLRVIAQEDDDLAFERIVNLPKRGLGDATLQRLHILARGNQTSLTRAARELVEIDELRPQARRSLGGLIDDFDRWRLEAATLPHTELAEMVLEESGYAAMWQASKAADAPGRLENLAELIRAMEGFENLAGFLEHISLVMDNEDRNDATDKVSIMTLHAAKGLEFDMVFLPGWEEGVFPNQRSLDETGAAGLEEERRLAYVGITRAKKKAHILFAANRRIYGQWQSAIPSRFIDELPKEHTERISDQGLYGSNSWGVAANAQDDNWQPQSGPGYGAGWQRAYGGSGQSARQQRKPVTIEGTARRVTARPAVSDFAVGERVFHDKFGYGTVEDVDGNKLEIVFEKSGTKKVLDSFVDRA